MLSIALGDSGLLQGSTAAPSELGKSGPSWTQWSQFAGWPAFHSIIESLRLEKTSKIIKSNHQPNTTMPAKPCPEVPHLHVF